MIGALSRTESWLLVASIVLVASTLVGLALGPLIASPDDWEFKEMYPGEVSWFGDGLAVAPYPDGTYWMVQLDRNHEVVWEIDDATEAEVVRRLRAAGEFETWRPR